MKDLNELNRYRRTDQDIIDMFGSTGNDKGGFFEVQSPGWGIYLRVIASNADGWDHVSVSCQHRAPIWSEMEFIKRLFFKDDETAMQLHVPPSHHLNIHPHTLHLWRPHDTLIPRPPVIMV